MACRCVTLAQPFFTGMPHGTRHDPPSFDATRRTIPYPSGAVDVSITEIKMAAHIGTHIDAARHFFADGRTIDQYPYERFIGPGVVLDARREGVVPITADELRKASPEIRADDIVFIYFGYAERFGQEAYRDHPYLSGDAAAFLVDHRVSIVGTDTITPDFPVARRSEGFDHPVHRLLLRHDVLIVENLGPGLKEVLGRRLTLAVPPLRIIGGDGSPVPACALLEE
jgi:arylformamidase